MTLKPLYLRVLLESHNYDRRNFARFGVLDIPGGARFLSSALRFTLVCIQKLCHLSIRLCFIRHSQLCKENIFKLFNGTSSPRGLGKRENPPCQRMADRLPCENPIPIPSHAPKWSGNSHFDPRCTVFCGSFFVYSVEKQLRRMIYIYIIYIICVW